MASYEINTDVAIQKLQSSASGLSDFFNNLSDAYALPGFPVVFPLFLLLLVGVGLYFKTKNLGVTIYGLTITSILLTSYFTGVHQYLMPITGALVIASAYLIWRGVTGGG